MSETFNQFYADFHKGIEPIVDDPPTPFRLSAVARRFPLVHKQPHGEPPLEFWYVLLCSGAFAFAYVWYHFQP